MHIVLQAYDWECGRTTYTYSPTLQPGTKGSVLRCCVISDTFPMKSRHRKLVRTIAFHSLISSHNFYSYHYLVFVSQDAWLTSIIRCSPYPCWYVWQLADRLWKYEMSHLRLSAEGVAHLVILGPDNPRVIFCDRRYHCGYGWTTNTLVQTYDRMSAYVQRTSSLILEWFIISLKCCSA